MSIFGTFFWISADLSVFTPLEPLEGLWGLKIGFLTPRSPRTPTLSQIRGLEGRFMVIFDGF